MNKFENSQRELKTANSRIESMKSQNKELVKHYRDLISKQSFEYEIQIGKISMISEDHYSNCIRHESKIRWLYNQIDQKQELIEKSKIELQSVFITEQLLRKRIEQMESEIGKYQCHRSEDLTMMEYYQNELKKSELSYNSLFKTSELKRKQTVSYEVQKNKAKAEVLKLRQVLSKREIELKKANTNVSELKSRLKVIEEERDSVKKDYEMLSQTQNSIKRIHEIKQENEDNSIKQDKEFNEESKSQVERENINSKAETEYLEQNDLENVESHSKGRKIDKESEGNKTERQGNEILYDSPLPVASNKRFSISPEITHGNTSNAVSKKLSDSEVSESEAKDNVIELKNVTQIDSDFNSSQTQEIQHEKIDQNTSPIAKNSFNLTHNQTQTDELQSLNLDISKPEAVPKSSQTDPLTLPELSEPQNLVQPVIDSQDSNSAQPIFASTKHTQTTILPQVSKSTSTDQNLILTSDNGNMLPQINNKNGQLLYK